MLADALEFLTPFDQDNGVRRAHLFQPQGVELALGIEPVEIEMQQLDRLAVERTRVFVD